MPRRKGPSQPERSGRPQPERSEGPGASPTMRGGERERPTGPPTKRGGQRERLTAPPTSRGGGRKRLVPLIVAGSAAVACTLLNPLDDYERPRRPNVDAAPEAAVDEGGADVRTCAPRRWPERPLTD